MKHSFSRDQLRDKICECWPMLGRSSAEELAGVLMNSSFFSGQITLSDFCFSKDKDYPSEHLLYCLCRYCFRLPQVKKDAVQQDRVLGT